MPNYCYNTLRLEHEDPAMIERARQAFKDERLLDEFVPVPKALKDTIEGGFGDPELQKKLEEQTEANLKKYGYNTWYDFCCNEWGTKWDVGSKYDDPAIEEDGTVMVCSFDSAWSPPTTAYNTLCDLGFRVYAMYHEPGCCFAGVYDNGDDECYDFSGMDAQQVRDEIPQEIDDMFGISESLEEMEEPDELVEWYEDGVEDAGLEPHNTKGKK